MSGNATNITEEIFLNNDAGFHLSNSGYVGVIMAALATLIIAVTKAVAVYRKYGASAQAALALLGNNAAQAEKRPLAAMDATEEEEPRAKRAHTDSSAV